MTARKHRQWNDRTAKAVLAALDDGSPLAWQARALCAEVGGDVWFPEKGEPARPAKQVCAGCPVRTPCLDYALENDIRFGVWGGLSERERREVNRRAA